MKCVVAPFLPADKCSYIVDTGRPRPLSPWPHRPRSNSLRRDRQEATSRRACVCDPSDLHRTYSRLCTVTPVVQDPSKFASWITQYADVDVIIDSIGGDDIASGIPQRVEEGIAFAEKQRPHGPALTYIACARFSTFLVRLPHARLIGLQGPGYMAIVATNKGLKAIFSVIKSI